MNTMKCSSLKNISGLITLTAILFIITSCASKHEIVLKNTMDTVRKDAPVVLSRTTIEKVTGSIADSMMPVLTSSKGDTIAGQADDTDLDGKWDEYALVEDFQPNETINLNVTLVNKADAPVFTKRANVHLGISHERNNHWTTTTKETMPAGHMPEDSPYLYQTEGPMWENDMISFEDYFDKRNGKDIFGKKTSKMVMDTLNILSDYHVLHDWGMDVLHVGASLGAGAVAIMENDSLIRLGQVDTMRYQQIFNGPVRARYQLTFKGWHAGKDSLGVVHTITIWAGQHGYQNDITVSNFVGQRELVQGIVNINAEPAILTKANSDYYVFGNYLAHCEHNDALNMGLIIPADQFDGQGKTPDTLANITQTDYVKLKIRPDQTVHTYFMAGWEGQNPKFKDKAYFMQLMQERAAQIANPIEVSTK